MSTPASHNRFAPLAPEGEDMDLDRDQPGVSASMHAPPSFADVTSGARPAAPLPHVPPSAQIAQKPQVRPSPGAWKPLPSSLRFKKTVEAPPASAQAQAGPSIGDKRPIEQVEDTASGDTPSRRANPAATPATAAATAPANVTAAVILGPPHANEAAKEVDVPQATATAAQDDMRVDEAPPAASLPLPTTYTPPDAARVLQQPADGFPVVYGLEQGLLSFVHNNSINLWKQLRGDNALVYIANDGLATDTVSRIKAIDAFFRAVFPDFPAPEVGPPEFFKRNDKKVPFKPVMPFCISGSSELIAALKTRKCWPTPSITLFVASLVPEVTDFAICLSGFPLERSVASDLIVTRAARDAIRNDVRICAFITNNNDNLPLVQPDQYINFVVGSIVVKSHAIVEDNASITVFSLYITPPTRIPDRLKQWIQSLKQLRYGCFRGTGFACPVFYCDLCKGRDHPTAICPFAAIPGWPASPPFTNDNTANGAVASTTVNARGSFRGRGGRGGGRGRRGRGAF